MQAGADVNALSRTRGRTTPLQVASGHSSEQIVELLLTSGADVNINTESGNPLQHAIDNPNPIGIAKILLNHGADVNAKKQGVQTL
jgi:ankyrin repeat protein